MEIREFIEAYKAKKFMNTKDDIEKELEVIKYLPSADKIRLVKKIIDFCVEYDRGFVKFDSYKKRLSFLFEIIEAHTNLRFADNWADKMLEYDVSCENDLIDTIIHTFKKDYDASLELLDMMGNNMLMDNSIEASVAKVAQSVSENLDILTGALVDKIEGIDVEKIIPKDLDLDKLVGLLSKFK
jgi:hypothetical protein